MKMFRGMREKLGQATVWPVVVLGLVVLVILVYFFGIR